MRSKLSVKDFLGWAFDFHGHRCPAMPLGLRAGLAALEALGAKRSAAHELHLISFTGKDHAGGCFLDGLMVATGCTYGKSNIEKKYYNKLGFILIDTEQHKQVRVSVKPEFVEQMMRSRFVALRSEGMKPQEIDPTIVEPLINRILELPVEEFLNIGPVEPSSYKRPKGCFEVVRCSRCNEAVFTNKVVRKDDKVLCLECADRE